MLPKELNLPHDRDLYHLSSIPRHKIEPLPVFWSRLKSLAMAHVAMIQNLLGTVLDAGDS